MDAYSVARMPTDPGEQEDDEVISDADENPSPEELERDLEEAKAYLRTVQEKPASEREDDELDDAVYDASLRWLMLKWGEEGRAPFCPYCGERNWAIQPPLEFVVKENPLPSAVFPVICNECGHTTFVAALVADLPYGEGRSSLE
jgi:hypothetical protein